MRGRSTGDLFYALVVVVALVLDALVGGIILLVFEATEGTRGPNQFGPDPKQLVAPPMGYPQPGQPYVA